MQPWAMNVAGTQLRNKQQHVITILNAKYERDNFSWKHPGGAKAKEIPGIVTNRRSSRGSAGRVMLLEAQAIHIHTSRPSGDSQLSL